MADALAQYRLDPARASALAWWKTRLLTDRPSPVAVVRSDLDRVAGAPPERYFKLVHRLTTIPEAPMPPGVEPCPLSVEDAEQISGLIAACYASIRATPEEVRSWTKRPVHDPALWLGARAGGELVGCVVADLDEEAREMSLDWVQVRPDWQGRGVGKSLVSEALRRARPKADFATVSGDVDNETGPERLYRACGFEGDVVWHVYRSR